MSSPVTEARISIAVVCALLLAACRPASEGRSLRIADEDAVPHVEAGDGAPPMAIYESFDEQRCTLPRPILDDHGSIIVCAGAVLSRAPDGALDWTWTPAAEVRGEPAVGTDHIWVVDGQQVVAIDRASGIGRRLVSDVDRVVAIGPSTIVAIGTSEVRSLDPLSGEILWTVPATAPAVVVGATSQSIILWDPDALDATMIAADDGSVTRFSVPAGTTELVTWPSSRRIVAVTSAGVIPIEPDGSAGPAMSGTPVVAVGSVIVALDGDVLRARHAGGGDDVWTRQLSPTDHLAMVPLGLGQVWISSPQRIVRVDPAGGADVSILSAQVLRGANDQLLAVGAAAVATSRPRGATTELVLWAPTA